MAKFSFILVERPEAFGNFANLEEALRRLKALGYQGVELNLVGPAGFALDELARAAQAVELPVVSFLTGLNYFDEGLCLSSPQAGVRQRAVERLADYTAIAALFGAVLVIGQMQGFQSDEPDRALGEGRIEECLKRVAEAAERNGAHVVLEPVNHLQAGFNNTLGDVLALVECIRSDCLRPMLDSFHMNIEERSLTEAIYRAGRDLGHFHLCESNGSSLGSGHLDFKVIVGALNAIGYTGYTSIKVYRQPWAVAAEASLRHLHGCLLT